MRIAVYNRFWATAGGGEKFAGGIAEALSDPAAGHEVVALGHGSVDLATLGARLSLDLSRVRFEAVDPSPSAVEEASARFDVFVNASYGSLLHNRSPHGIYVVHFPTLGAPPPTGWRRFALRVVGRLAKLTGAELEPARWVRGVYAPEPLGPITHRWTDGHGVLQVRRSGPVALLCATSVLPGTEPVEVTVSAGGAAGLPAVRRRLRRGRIPFGLVRAGAVDGPGELHVRSAASMPAGPASDQRLLGVSVVAALAGPRWWWPLQAVHQTLSAAADDLGFLASYRQVVSNSAFTAGWVQRLWALETPVLNPPVRAQTPAEKEPIILHVGRFFAPEAGHSKRQLELVEAFGMLVRSGAVDGWTLHLVGGCDDEGRPYLERVRSAIGGLPVELHPNAGGDELRSLYGRASIYWHATGLGEDP
ncbi:MAG: hypothetical protein R2749_21890, partial [Acidimicrobiales bacterium]